jgi:hypothetical protein
MEDAILHGCIPVIIQDGVQLPYENVLDYEAFALRIPESRITRIPAVLRNVPPGVVKMMQASLAKVWYRFRWNQHKWAQQTVRQLAGQRNASIELERPAPSAADRGRRALGLQQVVEPELDAMQTLVEFLHGKMMAWKAAEGAGGAAEGAGGGSAGASSSSSSSSVAGIAGDAGAAAAAPGGNSSWALGAGAAAGGAGLLQGILSAVSEGMAGVLGAQGPSGGPQALAQRLAEQQRQAEQLAQQGAGSDAPWHTAAAIPGGGAAQQAAAAAAAVPAVAAAAVPAVAAAAVVPAAAAATAAAVPAAAAMPAAALPAAGGSSIGADSFQPALKLGSLHGMPSGEVQALPLKAGAGLVMEQDYEDAVPLA